MTQRPPYPSLTEEENNDLVVLELTDERHMFRAPVAHPPIHIGRIMARIIDNGYLALVDIEPGPVEGHLNRVFKMTEKGIARYDELRKKVQQ